MSLSNLAVRRPVGTAITFAAIVLLGVVASRQLAVDLMPEVDMPSVSVTTTYEGVAPEEIESLVTRPLEQALARIEGIEEIQATSSEGRSRLSLRFSWGTDLDEALDDVREQLDRVRGSLPEDAETPSVFKFNLSDFPAAFLGLSGGGDPRRLRNMAEETISRRLERVPGIASIDVRGGRVREIQVLLDPSRLSALGVAPSQVSRSLRTENRNVAAGDMLESGREVLIRTQGEFSSLDDIAETVVTLKDGRPIRVQDLGTVVDSYREVNNELWIDGEPGIRMAVSKRSGANTVEVVRELRREIEAINRDFAGRVRLSMLWDGADFIEKSVSNVERGALYGAGLAVLVLLIFLRDLRSTLIIGTAIPISILATLALMYFCGFTLNVISLGGIALGVGMLVDSAIVVLENIYRKRGEKLSPTTAAVSGSREVALAILAGTLTTVAVFVPVVFIGGFEGVFFKEMAVVVCFALLCALLVALTLIPAAAARFARGGQPRGLLGPLFARSERLLDRLDESYARSLRRSLTHPWRVVVGAFLLLAVSLALFPLLGFELMPETDEGRVDVSVELPVGTPVENTAALMRRLESRVRGVLREGELLHMVTLAGPESWWRPTGGHRGSMEIVLVPVSKRGRSADEIAGEIQGVLADVPGAEIRVQQRGSNPMMRMTRGGGDERLAVEIRGHSLTVAGRLGERVAELLQEVPGVSWARPDREEGAMERTLHLDRSRLADLGLTGGEVADAVEHYVLGRVASRYRDAGEEFDIRVQLAPGARELLEQLPRLPIVTPDGRSVSLEAVATIASRRGPSSINREDQQRILRVSAGTLGRPLGDIAADVRARLADLEVPDGFSVLVGGELEEQRKVFTSLLTGILLAIFLVYAVMAVQFESLLHPLIIMTSVPFSLIGVILGLLLTGTTFNMNSFLGTIVLVGIVVNNAIVLVDYVNLLRREERKSLKVALIEGGRRRLRPILMTSLTTALGLLPIALGIGEGSEIQAPLARVVIGGLTTSTLLTLFFVPCLYFLIEVRRRRRDEDEQPAAVSAEALGS